MTPKLDCVVIIRLSSVVVIVVIGIIAIVIAVCGLHVNDSHYNPRNTVKFCLCILSELFFGQLLYDKQCTRKHNPSYAKLIFCQQKIQKA